MFERNQLHDDDAVMRSLGNRKMEVARQPREAVEIVDLRFRFGQQSAQGGNILVGCVLRCQLGAERLDRALRIHDLGRADTGEVELHRKRLGE